MRWRNQNKLKWAIYDIKEKEVIDTFRSRATAEKIMHERSKALKLFQGELVIRHFEKNTSI